jgi:TonB family protein
MLNRDDSTWRQLASNKNSPPNTRVQRTRSSPSALRSPLTRRPLGRRIALVAAVLSCLLVGIAAGTSPRSADGAADSPAEKPVPVDTKCNDLQAPVLTHRVEPRYPEHIRKERWEGKVELHGIVGTDGKVSDIAVRASPGKPLSDLAVEAVSLWRYTPAYCKDLGKPVRVYVSITTTFRLNRK